MCPRSRAREKIAEDGNTAKGWLLVVVPVIRVIMWHRNMASSP